MQTWVIWGSGAGHVTHFSFFDRLHIAATAAAGEFCVGSVCGAFDAAFAKLNWPLVFYYLRVQIHYSQAEHTLS